MEAREQDMQTENQSVNYAEDVQKDLIDTRKDSGKVAIAISIMSIILLVVFYFGFRQNFTELRHKVEALNGLQSRVVTLEQDVAALKTLPQKTKYMLMGTMTQEMANKAAYLGTQAASKEQAAKILQARQLLDDIQKEFAAAAQ
ncbi:hypothetical protein [Desulfoplanes formicivorans]|uniref:Uncharacterized protein n=1 Tax=Desulfoplanes formicivorans TaxID=1592317 RepID=A0A194AHX5_9BACT|nr:hypothetical protein [Desulfoplanes formicivorans]GAU08928.1 hypothetical protein DPF_1647 [Desulfoplanes formicivorans]